MVITRIIDCSGAEKILTAEIQAPYNKRVSGRLLTAAQIISEWKIAILGLFAAVVISGCANESTNQPVEPDPEPTKTAVTEWKVVADGDNDGIARLLGNAIFYDDNTWCILATTGDSEFASGTYPDTIDTTKNTESPFTANVTALNLTGSAPTTVSLEASVSITDNATNLSVTIDLSSMGMGEQTFKFTRI